MSEPTGTATLLPPPPSRPRTAPPPPGPRKDPMGVMADLVTPADGALGLVLWRALRDVYLWAGSEPGERAGRAPGPEIAERLAEARERAPELADAVAVFARLAVAPAQADPAVVAGACHQVYEWARMEHRAELAVLFAEAAATADPASPARANEAGRECKRAALHERSAVWYQRAFGLAVGARDREAAVRALLGYGEVMHNLGRYGEARILYERAARRAVRTGRRKQAALAHHYLLAIAAENGSYKQVEKHALLALQLYPLHHPRIPFLAHDFAVALVHQRFHSTALLLLERVVPLIAADRLLVLSTLARAAAGCGRRERFQSAREEVDPLVRSAGEFVAAALVNLAEASYACGERDRSQDYARRAIEMARARNETEPERDARELLRRIAAHQPAPRESELPPENRVGTLLPLFIGRLVRWAAPRQRARRPGDGAGAGPPNRRHGQGTGPTKAPPPYV